MQVDTIDQISRQTQKNNAAFKRLSKSKQRVAIAKDVLKWLDLKKIRATRGTYVGNEQRDEGEFVKCDACAIGALFVCGVSTGKATLNDLADGLQVDIGEMEEALSPYFTKMQLRTIEAAFERFDTVRWYDDVNGYWHESGDDLQKRTKAFNKGVRSSKKSLQRIMRNIIRNEGKFVP